MKKLFLLISSIAITTNNVYPLEIEDGIKFISPDGSKVFYLSTIDRDSYYNIVSGENHYFIKNEHYPVLKVQWSKDSKSVFTMNHAYHEVVVQILNCLQNKETGKYNLVLHDIKPPIHPEGELFYNADRWIECDGNLLVFCYYIIQQKNFNPNPSLGRDQIKKYTAKFKANILTGKSFDLKAKEVNDYEWEAYIKIHGID